MTSQEKIWKVIRGINAGFTVEDVMVLTEQNRSTVSSYLRALLQSGYIRKTGTRRQARGRSQDVYRLIKNTGPKPPVQRTCLYDPNLDNLTEVKEVGDVA